MHKTVLKTVCALILGCISLLGQPDVGGITQPVTGGAGYIQTLVAPDHTKFTQQNWNGGGSTTTEIDNTVPVTSITILQHQPSVNIVALAKPKIAATFTITAAFSFAGDPGTLPLHGLWLSDGGAPPNNLFWCYRENSGQQALGISVWTSFTAFGSNPYTDYGGMITGSLRWMRIQETASNRIFSVSSDGITFSQVFTEANTAHFTTAAYGWGLIGSNGSADNNLQMTTYSFSETNP